MTQTNISRVLNCCCQPCVIPQKESLVSATHQVFLPAYAPCPTELGNLQSHLIPTLLNKIEKLLRGIFLIQGSTQDLLHCRQTLYLLSHQDCSPPGSSIHGTSWTRLLDDWVPSACVTSSRCIYYYWKS
ncbi:unnamed protein product [Rangifer tarandus platyrhynchus]|uniref:Uncharacterized protein n=2 Tax=Rangifer tarandus platyrhynchus TaxID=3082113 RepID=A0AC59YKH7_RANTA|nr:unnamed protein product [Rangifer tarandus platyrhynchus]